MKMANRAELRRALEDEVRRWSAISYSRIHEEIRNRGIYQIASDSEEFQVEVILLEDTETYWHVGLSIDDGRLLTAMRPVCDSFVNRK